ncbi:hypothetical protein EDB89DRAFT_2068599 [Lactarius sanguifluus]|nr:hypothetical protein EDB89DRAFT_2068599 [Lactarius sanguifluus]
MSNDLHLSVGPHLKRTAGNRRRDTSRRTPGPSFAHQLATELVSSISSYPYQNGLLALASSRTDGPTAQPQAGPLSPIPEQSYVPTPTSRRDLFPTDVEPWHTSVSSFDLFPLPTTSLKTIDLDICPVYPPISHRAGPQVFSTVYEDTASERTGSFVTARSLAGDTEDLASPLGRAAVDVCGPSGSATSTHPPPSPAAAVWTPSQTPIEEAPHSPRRLPAAPAPTAAAPMPSRRQRTHARAHVRP